MRYYEIMHTDLETQEQREWRLQMIYGHDDDEDELNEVELEGAKLKNEAERAKAFKLNAEGVAKLIDASKKGTLEADALDEMFPWPRGGSRSLTDSEKQAIWVRASIVAGKPLPPF